MRGCAINMRHVAPSCYISNLSIRKPWCWSHILLFFHLPTLAYSSFSPPCLCVYACLFCPLMFSANSGTPIDSITNQTSPPKLLPKPQKKAKNRPDMSQLSHTLSTARHLDNILSTGWRCDYYIINNVVIIIIINLSSIRCCQCVHHHFHEHYFATTWVNKIIHQNYIHWIFDIWESYPITMPLQISQVTGPSLCKTNIQQTYSEKWPISLAQSEGSYWYSSVEATRIPSTTTNNNSHLWKKQTNETGPKHCPCSWW